MMRHRAASLVVLFVLAGMPSPARAWTDNTRLRMVEDALKATPPALNALLLRYREDLYRGVLDPSRHEGEEVHFQHADGGAGMAAAGVAHKAEEVRTILVKKRSLRRFVYEMGTLAHLVSDVGFPLNASDGDAREPLYREAYQRYIERSLSKIPFVLDRSESDDLKKGDLQAFMMTRAREAAAGYDLIGPAFKDDGTPATRDSLDVRSIPFGVASLAYSRAASDIVRVWLYVWGSVNGDLSGTPYMDPTDETKKESKKRSH